MGINVTTAKKGIDLQTVLTSNGKINVWNEESGSGDVHTVHLDDTGSVEKCTCKGYKHHGSCYHVDAVQQNGSLRSAARACMGRDETANLLGDVLTDGGQEEDDTNPCSECGEDMDGRFLAPAGPEGDTCIMCMDDSERDVVEAYPETEEIDDTPL